MPKDFEKSTQRANDIRSGAATVGRKVSDLVQVLLDSGSETESGRVGSIHCGRDIYDCTVTVKLTKVQ